MHVRITHRASRGQINLTVGQGRQRIAQSLVLRKRRDMTRFEFHQEVEIGGLGEIRAPWRRTENIEPADPELVTKGGYFGAPGC
jgi:hypothetical protein